MALTKTDVVKQLLLAVGEDNTQTSSLAYTLASDMIDTITKEVLGLGWNFNTTYDSNGAITSITTSTEFENVPGYIQGYIVAKSIYEFVLGYTGENTFSQDYNQSVQQAYMTALNEDRKFNLGMKTYDEILESIEIQLKNEEGWWFNSATDEGSVPNVPVTLPAIVQEYAKAKAKRIYTAYNMGNIELLTAPSVEEQELYNKMLEVHNKNIIRAKSLDTLRDEVTLEVLNDGWDFNTRVDTYSTLKAAGLIEKVIRAHPVYDNIIIIESTDGNNKILINRETQTELSDDTKIKLVYSITYAELPLHIKPYVDMKAMRLYKFYNDNKNSLSYAQPTPEEIMLYQKLRGRQDTDYEAPSMLDKSGFDWLY